MKSTTFNWKTKDQLDVHAIDWVPEGDYKAVIALVHGFGEHCERYHHVADFYGENGYAMTSYDHRGHGKTGGKRGHTPNYDALLDGIDDLLKYTAEKHPGKPIILYGHSMGGNLVLNYMLRRKPNVKAVVATAPWIKLGFEPPAFLITLGKITRRLVPGFTQDNGLDSTQLSRDTEVAKAYDAVCTPDIFLFDANHGLYYRGQFDDTRPGAGVAHGGDLKAAGLALLAGEPAPDNTRPSVGCSIKWKN